MDFFYVDLAGVSLDSDTVIEKSKWFDLNNIKFKPDPFPSSNPILGGKNNDKTIFLEKSSINDDKYRANIFDIKLEQWETNKDVVGKPKGFLSGSASWISDEKTGLAYSFNSVSDGIIIFDSVNLAFVNKDVSNPQNLFNGKIVTYDNYAQVLLPSGQILYIGGSIGNENDKQSMRNILTYNIITDTWQMMVWNLLDLLVINIVSNVNLINHFPGQQYLEYNRRVTQSTF